jgi:hypothetical protein
MKYLIARLREPSTYAGLAALLASFGLSLDAGLVQSIALLGTGLAGVVAAFMPDRG